MNWFIGQEIVAIRTHSENAFQEGDTFKIQGLKGAACSCGHILIDIGLTHSYLERACAFCGCHYIQSDGAWWMNEKSFAPLDTLEKQIAELLSEPTPIKNKI